MDNLAHTLVGAALGRAIADRKVPAPALVGAFAANIPDIAELFFGLRPGRRSDYLTLHRNITHSFIGAAVEIVVLALLVGLIAVICVAAVTLLGQEISTAFSTYALAFSSI